MLEALDAYHRSGQTPFTPPGHKQGLGADPRAVAVLGPGVFRSDLLATSGLDDRSASGGVLERAQRLMADAVGATHTFFSTCGSSLSVKASMLAVAGPGEKLLVGRDAHKSVVAGLILSGMRPVWVDPQWDAERHLAHPPSVDAFDEALREHPDAKGALVTSPTPYGSCADLSALAALCHRHGLPLLVDEAWGAHLPFHDDLPTWAMDAGADVCVTSVHKMGSGLEQGSVFHLSGGLVDPAVLKSREDLLGTTSPSVLIYAALDAWRRHMVEEGKELLQNALELAGAVRSSIASIDGMHVDGRPDYVGPGLAADLDPLPVVIDVSGLGISGYRGADWLRRHHRVNLHLADHRRISAQLTYADDHDSAAALLTALRDLADNAPSLRPATAVHVPPPVELRLEQAALPRDAYFGPTEQVPLRDAVGRVAAEMVTPYPPGIPVVVPGERLNGSVLAYLASGEEAGMVVPDTADPRLATLRVVAERA